MSDHHQFRLHSGKRVSFYPPRQELLLHESDGSAKSLPLGYAEARLLGLLLEEPGAIRSRDEILSYAWEHRVVAPGSLTQAIFALRNLIEDGRHHEIVQTVPRRGYRFNAEYLVEDEAREPSAVETPAADPVAAAPIPAQGAGGSAPERVVSARAERVQADRIVLWATFYLALAFLLGWIVHHRAEIASSLSRDVHVETSTKGGVVWHFVDVDASGAQGIRGDLAASIDAMPDNAQGAIWVNRMFRMYDFSCVRSDERATEMVVSESAVRQGKLPALLASCLEKAP